MNSKDSFSQQLVKKVWRKETGYYQKAKLASEEVLEHSGFKIINKFLADSKSILDVGCGEGTKLHKLGPSFSHKVGVDISLEAIKIARKQYPKITFKCADIENVPFAENSFDTCLSTFVLEHTQNPKVVLKEMIRVTKTGGLVIVICPNFGAPNRHSPCFKGSLGVKLVIGLVNQLIIFGQGVDSWKRVEPKTKKGKYFPDWDTLVEPEILTLMNYLQNCGLKIEYWSSLWEEEVPEANKIQKVFQFLANLKIYPFIYWGPQILVIARKNGQ